MKPRERLGSRILMSLPGPRQLGGQALVLLMVFVAVLAVGVVLLFDTGQATKKKIKVTNAADAAAYSMAVQEARALNFAAYMNRVRIANEVTIAQGLSMWSFANMAHSHTAYGLGVSHIMMSVPPTVIPGVWSMGKSLHSIYYPLEKNVVAPARDGIHTVLTAGGIIPGVDNVFEAVSRLNGVYAWAASSMLNISQAEAALVAERVMELNDPDAGYSAASLAILGHSIVELNDGFLERHEAPAGAEDGHEGMDRFRNVVMGSRDRWSAKRGVNFNLGIVSAGTYGGTDLVAYDRWAAADAANVGVWRFNAVLGHGGAQALPNGEGSFAPGIGGGDGWYSDDHGNQYQPYGDLPDGFPSAVELVDTLPAPDVNTDIPLGTGGANAVVWYCRHHKWRLPHCLPADGWIPQPFVYPYVIPIPHIHGGDVPSGNLKSTSDAFFSGYQGLQPYHDVNLGWARSPEGDSAGPRYTAYIVGDLESARTSEYIDGIGAPEGGQVRLEACEERVTAIATGQAYFSRPHSSNLPSGFRRQIRRTWDPGLSDDTRGLEQGSTFSPYWQARLVETPQEHKQMAYVETLATGGC